jgi:hypothetical protein
MFIFLIDDIIVRKEENLMEALLLTLLVGCIAGIIDILPMIKMKLNRYAISSAFIFYFVMPFIIFNLNLLNSLWWLKGGIVTLVLSLPVIIIVSQEDKKSVLPMGIMAVVLGTGIGVAGYFLGVMV